mgnify:CR=1 FL=1
MKALGNWVVLKRKDEEVTSVGKEVEDLVVGDQVYYDFAAGSQLRVSGEDIFTVISEKHIVIKL